MIIDRVPHTAQSETDISAATMLVAASRARATFEKDFIVMMVDGRSSLVIRYVGDESIKKKDKQENQKPGMKRKTKHFWGLSSGSFIEVAKGGRRRGKDLDEQEPAGIGT